MKAALDAPGAGTLPALRPNSQNVRELPSPESQIPSVSTYPTADLSRHVLREPLMVTSIVLRATSVALFGRVDR